MDFSFRIRPAVPEDAPELDALLTLLIREEAQWDNTMNPNFTVSDNYAGMIGKGDCWLLKAEERGEILGYLCGFLYRTPVQEAPLALLDALYVRAEHRSRGIGSALVGEFRTLVREAGAAAVELKVFSANSPANRLYEGQGFSELKRYLRCPL